MKRWRVAAAVLSLLIGWVMVAFVTGGAMGASAAVEAAHPPAAAGQIITQTVTLIAARDNTIYQDQGKVSNGAGQHIFAGNTNNSLTRRGLLAFNLGVIPPDATVISAAVTLNMSKTLFGESAVSLHAVSADWGEGDSDALGEEGAGATAMPGDATWLHTFYDGEFWAAPGGDYAAAASATVMVGSPGSYTWQSAGLLADVAGWVADPATNFGWALLGDEAGMGTAKRFDSREHPSAAARPMLTVTFAAEAVELPPPVYVPVVMGE